jgi:putative peptidoglycan lipid II flippase
LALLLMRAFYALKDTKTPVIVSILSVFINIIFSYYFIQVLKYDVWSLGVAYAISSNVALVLLIKFLGDKLGGFTYQELVKPALKMLFAAVLAAIALYLPIKALDQLVVDTTKTFGLLILTSIASGFGLGLYLLLVWWMKVPELYSFRDLLVKIYKRRFSLESQEIVKESGSV